MLVPSPVINILQHLTALAHSHGGGSDGSNSCWVPLSTAHFMPPLLEVQPQIKWGWVKATFHPIAGLLSLLEDLIYVNTFLQFYCVW